MTEAVRDRNDAGRIDEGRVWQRLVVDFKGLKWECNNLSILHIFMVLLNGVL
jgi:hypothetical protein